MAAAAFGALLDRSVMQIEAAAADGRTFDRETVRSVSDAWDNNTFPLFCTALARTRWGRERRARTALAWTAALGVNRRAWMTEQLRTAGHRPETVLPTSVEDAVPARDYRGVVMPRLVPVTEEIAGGLAADYDLTGADVRTLQMERVGVDGLIGFLKVAAGRRYPTDTATDEPAGIELRLDDVTEVRFDSGDRTSAAISVGPGGVTIGIGTDGVVTAKNATVYCDDRYWHLSAAGLAVDRTTPPRDERPAGPEGVQRPERLEDAVLVAATVLRAAMGEIRSVRYTHMVGKVPIVMFCQAFAGAGSDILAAGGHWSAGHREAAFRRLVEEWADRADPVLRARFRHWLSRVGDHPQICKSTRSWLATLTPETISPSPSKEPASHRLSSQAELRLASYTAAHTRHGQQREASSVLNLALPPHAEATPDEPWKLRTLKIANTTRFRLHTTAFAGPHRTQSIIDQDVVRSFALPDEALTVRRADG
ncbi:hypothetical protein [Actinomadura sp. K4S16]|uniref:hypothetical protein n=1 Tax=Actinomadura sp. K4S16 TaxID=1316147 RepID=UPI0011EDF220|nr:hypothetical protein [Actinomadura sp. K4S16]